MQRDDDTAMTRPLLSVPEPIADAAADHHQIQDDTEKKPNPNCGGRLVLRIKYTKKPSTNEEPQLIVTLVDKKKENGEASASASASSCKNKNNIERRPRHVAAAVSKSTKYKLEPLDDIDGLDDDCKKVGPWQRSGFDDAKFEAVKRKVRERYQEHENAKKARKIQVVDIPANPKRGGDNIISHKQSLIKKINGLKQRNTHSIHSYSLYKPLAV